MLIYQVWKQDIDPTDAVNPYTPYTFVDKIPSYDLGLARREAVMLIPGLDGVVSAFGKRSGPLDKKLLTVGFRVLTNRGPVAAHDLLMAAIMGKDDVRLVMKTETGYLRFTNAALVSVSEPHDNMENYYVDFKVTWRIRADWRPRYTESADVWTSAPEYWDGTPPGGNETFGTGGTTNITSVSQVFNVDLRGTAGTDMPTLPTTDGIFYVVGPAGGDSGMSFANESVFVKDQSGKLVPYVFSVNAKLPTSSDSLAVNLASQSCWLNGSPIRPFKPDFQPEYFRYDPNIINVCVFSALGANQLTGGNLTVDMYRKFA